MSDTTYQHEFNSTVGVGDFNLKIEESAPDGYPVQKQPDEYIDVPMSEDIDQRRRAFLDHILANPAPDGIKGHFSEMARVSENCGPVHNGYFRAAIRYIDQRRDCSDFVMLGIQRLLLQFPDSPLVDADVYDECRRCILEFKYWPDEPGVDSMCTWTENHQIMFSADEYLAGQMYPDEIFTNSGMSGRQKMQKARHRILQWLDLRFQTGFNEWLSNVYYDEDLTALINLVDFCLDEEIVIKSAMVADLLLFDMAVNSWRGQFVSTHGRSYFIEKTYAPEESTSDTAKLVFGMGRYAQRDNMSAITLALSVKYKIPETIIAVGREVDRAETINHQRVAIKTKDAYQWGLRYRNIDDLMTLLSFEAYTHPRTISPMVKLFDAFGWWENQFFPEHKQLKWVMKVTRPLGILRLFAHLAEKDINRNNREENHIETFRTPDYQLSCSQDYKKGTGGDQHHIWQATIGPGAVCFTTHPGGYGETSPTAYWHGSGFLPRVAQHRNVAVVIYKTPKIGGILVSKVLPFTHAWFPEDRFDETEYTGHWAFARYSNGYLAIGCNCPMERTVDGKWAGKELIAQSRQTVWVCELGNKAQWGSFDSFKNAITGSSIEYCGLNIRYQSPSFGTVEFGWQGPLRIAGNKIQLKDYPRYENPWCKASFPPREISIEAAGKKLGLDFEKLRREENLMV